MCVCAFITSVYVCIEIERGEGVVEGTFTEREERERNISRKERAIVIV